MHHELLLNSNDVQQQQRTTGANTHAVEPDVIAIFEPNACVGARDQLGASVQDVRCVQGARPSTSLERELPGHATAGAIKCMSFI